MIPKLSHLLLPVASLSLLKQSTISTFKTLSILHKMSTRPEPKPISPSTTRVGWIGTGVMGQAMCSHILKAGYSVTVYNRTISKAQPLITLGAKLADSPVSVALNSDVVFTILGFPSDVSSVILGRGGGGKGGEAEDGKVGIATDGDGLLSHLSPGSIVVDMTTSDPSLAASIAEKAVSRSCVSIDAPVSGGDRGAKNGCLSIFAGGDKDVISSLSPLLSLLGTTYHMGGPGSGQHAKLGNQITIASNMVGLVEGMVYAHKAGLELELFLKAISKGAAGSKSLELYGGRILARDFEAGFYVDHFVKDLGICLKECERMGICLPGLALAQQLYLSLKAHGEGRLGTQALVLALERLNNVSLKLSG